MTGPEYLQKQLDFWFNLYHDELASRQLQREVKGGIYLLPEEREEIKKLVEGHTTGPAGEAALKKLRGN